MLTTVPKAARRRLAAATLSALLAMGAALPAFAHCDTLDGPVVAAARAALDRNDPNLVLIWVKKENEREIIAAFDRAVAVRKLNRTAADMADTSFFETLVRVHRQGEGAPFTGLKPAGADLGPAIPAADRAIATGDIQPVTRILTDAMQAGLRDQFAKVQALKGYNKDNVVAGREYIEAYVEYVHYVEGLYDAAKAEVHGHYEEHAAVAAPSTTCTVKSVGLR